MIFYSVTVNSSQEGVVGMVYGAKLDINGVNHVICGGSHVK